MNWHLIVATMMVRQYLIENRCDSCTYDGMGSINYLTTNVRNYCTSIIRDTNDYSLIKVLNELNYRNIYKMVLDDSEMNSLFIKHIR